MYRLLKRQLLQPLQNQKQNLQRCCHQFDLRLVLLLLLPPVPLLLELRAKQNRRRRIIHLQLQKHW
jgi:hypothetical protein